MNERNPQNSMPIEAKKRSGYTRILGKSIMATACALTLAFYGCSKKGSTPAASAVIPTDVNKPEVKAVVTAVDSLLKANKGKGKGVITGFLTGEGKSIAQGLLKQASNAAGERRLMTKTEIPLTGATILIFNALKPTTAPDATLKTDSTGSYQALLPEGKYFGFAVYLDLETFQLVTTSIPNMNPKADSIVKMDTATAIEDVTAPTAVGVYDAASANSDGVFLVGAIPDKDAKINITFSEPMNRESAKKISIGTIDTSNTSTSMILKDLLDTSKVKMTWSGDSKELTLNIAELTTGVQYGVVIPSTLKDLAKNPLAKEFKATFVTASAQSLADIPFAVSSSMPEDKGTLKPIQNPSISFNRPVEAFSVLKNAKIEPAVTGYFEISGARAVFIHKEPLAVGKTYTITFPTTITDLAGHGIVKDYSYAFSIKDFEGAAKNTTGKKQEVALSVEALFDAYLAGDVGRFGAGFHANFRMYNDDGGIKSKTEFLDMISHDVADKQALAAGFMGPVFDNSDAACKDGGNVNRWKVNAEGGTSADQVWVDAYVNPGQSPGVYKLGDGSVIPNTELTWDPTGPRFTYKGKKYGFGPDMTKFHGPVNMDNAKNDRRYMGDLLAKSSTVALEAVKLISKEEFNVDPNVVLSTASDTAFVAVKMINNNSYNRTNFGEHEINCNSGLADTNYQILKFIVVNDGSKWLVTAIVSGGKNTKEDLAKGVTAADFKVKTISPIDLVSPVDANAQGADGKVTFKFKGAVSDSVGGYIVGLSEDPKFCFGRPPFGALIFVKASNTTGKEESFMMNSAGGVEGSNANVILRRAQDLKLPGWERVMFENPVTKFYDTANGFGGVFNWKVIAVRDTSAVQFLANGFNPSRFYGESDFGKSKGYFACQKFPSGNAFDQLQTAQQKFSQGPNNNLPMNTFNDMDLDGFPDMIELKYKTDPKDRNSYPDFRVDTDGDGLADFLEAMLDPKGTDSLVTKKADAAGVKAEIVKLAALGIIWQDTDGDGFPDDIEMMFGFNPNDPKNNPGTHARASAPIGVFAGKLQVGANQTTLSFKLSADTTKALTAAYTVVVGSDTLVDTVRAMFGEISGEVMFPVALSKMGPDAGRALLLRGHYDANMGLLMGPIDMIQAVAKTSTNFGGGPNVGHFAASGRGEDVARYLGGGSGGQGGAPGVGPVGPNMGPIMISYRLPPAGVSEGSKLVFGNGAITLINDFGDTVVLVQNLSFRLQPDGGYQFNGEKKVANGAAYSRFEVGGTIILSGDSWVLDGHLFQESDSAGIHKQIPGQINGKAAKGDITFADGSKLSLPVPQFAAGTFKGWIAQDKTGSGFAAQPMNNPTMPFCDPAKGPCATQPPMNCNPANGPCNTNPAPCVAGQPCNTPPPAQLPGTGPAPTSFTRPFMGGMKTFSVFLEKNNNKVGEYFFVALNGRVYKAKYDSTHVQDSKAPLCGQVTMNLELVDLKDQTSVSISAHQNDSMMLPTVKGTIFVLIEDQFTPGMPSRTDKIRDSYGDVRANVFVVEMRLVGTDYGSSSMTCGTVMGPNNPPPTGTPPTACDPVKGCPTNPPPCDRAVAGCITNPPLTNPPLTNPPPACDPVKGCPTNPPTTNPPPCDPAIAGCVTNPPLTNPPPCDPITGCVTNPPLTNPPPADTGKPPVYKGTLENANIVMTGKFYKVKVGSPAGLVATTIAQGSIRVENGLVLATDFSDATKVYVFMGDKMDQTKLFITLDGSVLVTPKM